MLTFSFKPYEGKPGTIRNVVFDIGNVLSDFRWKEAIEDCSFPKETADFLARTVFLGDLWPEYDRGVMGDAKVTALLRERCAGYEREFDELFRHFGEFVREREYAQPLVAGLRKAGYGVYILSNYGDTMFQSNCRYFRFLPETDGAVFSWLEKRIKPDRRLYEILLERYGLKGEECLFLDDSQANVDGAINAGLCARQAESLEMILQALEDHGILPES